MEGYIRNKPDTNWWLEQITAGEDFRKQKAYTEQWDKWRAFYRGDWEKGVMPINLFFTLIRTIIPRVYFRNPSVSISPGQPGLESLIFSKVLERVDNKVLHNMKMKNTMKKVLHDAFLFGTGVPKIGFSGFYNPSGVGGNSLVDEKGNKLEYFTGAQKQMPWTARVRPDRFVVPAGLESFEHTRWVAEEIYRPIEDLRDDPRFTNTAKLKVSDYTATSAGNIERKIQMAKLYEVRDLKTGKVFVIAPDHGSEDDKSVLFEDDALLQFGKVPYFPIQFNYDDEFFWAIPDSKILEPYQLDINENQTQITQHRRLTIIKILARRKSISEEAAEAMISEDVSAVVFVDGEGPLKDQISMTQGGTIPPELFSTVEQTRQNVRETIGFSRNQSGESTGGQKSHSQTTATEASIVQAAAEIRIDERRDMVADVLVEMVEMMHPTMFENWGKDQVVDIIGPGGIPVWVIMSQKALQEGQFNIRIDPESAMPETRALRERRAMELYQILKTNPIIDPIKLTQYLLFELKGTQFDDMMRMLPAPAGGPPSGPVAPNELAGMVSGGFKQLSQGNLAGTQSA